MQLLLPLKPDRRLLPLRDRLLARYGPQRDPHRHDPTSQFVKAMISSCTYDADSQAGFEALRLAFPSWEMLADADPAKVAIMIRCVRLPAEKARDLVNAALAIRALRGSFDLSFLTDWPFDASSSWLRRIKGVGPKITAATLNFSTLRKRALTADRHVLRLAKRIGFVRNATDFDRGFRVLMRSVPPEWDADDLYELHWLMKMHGQRVCRVYFPLCDECPLAPECPSMGVRDDRPRARKKLGPHDHLRLF